MTSQALEDVPSAHFDRGRRRSVSFVLPAHNEEENIAKAIEDTVAVASRHCSQFDVIVVDDGSTDRTAERADACSARYPQVRLVRHVTNLGYGEALRSGFSEATQDFVFYTDTDNQFDMGEFPYFWLGRTKRTSWPATAPCAMTRPCGGLTAGAGTGSSVPSSSFPFETSTARSSSIAVSRWRQSTSRAVVP